MKNNTAKIETLSVESLDKRECLELCSAAQDAIEEEGGLDWVKPLPIHTFERFWQGVVLVPERHLFIGKIDSVVAGSVQLIRPYKHEESRRLIAYLTTLFVAPWGQGMGLARSLVQKLEEKAQEENFEIIELDIRNTQKKAINLFNSMGYEKWGSSPRYAFVGGEWISGAYLSKVLRKK